MDTREYMLKRLKIYISKHYHSPKSRSLNWRTNEIFAQESYRKWAAYEFLNYLSNSNQNLYFSAEEFIKMVDNFSCDDRHKTRWMFSVAYDVALDLYDVLYEL